MNRQDDRLEYITKKVTDQFKKHHGRRPVFVISISGKLRTIDITAPFWKKSLETFKNFIHPYADVRIVGCTDLQDSYVDENDGNYNRKELEFSKLTDQMSEQRRLEIAKKYLNFDYLYIQEEHNIVDSEFTDQTLKFYRDHRQFKKFAESIDNFNFDILFKARFDMILHSPGFDPRGFYYLVVNFIHALQQKYLIPHYKNYNHIWLDDFGMQFENINDLEFLSKNLVLLDDWGIFYCVDSVKSFCQNYKNGLRAAWDGKSLKNNMTWLTSINTRNVRIWPTRLAAGTAIMRIRPDSIIPDEKSI